MSDLLANLWMGFHVAANPFNILFCLLGALVGTLVGVLPGVGSVATIAMLLPITFGLPPVGALIMLAGIYYGAIRNLELPPESRDILKTKITNLMPTRQDLIDSSAAIARGTIIGSLVGILPGGGAVIASFAAYTFEKKLSKHPERFGRGAIQGVAAPESANNAAAQTSFIPLLTLGIPPNAVMALMVGAMTIH